MSGLGIDALGSDRQVSECSGGQRSKIILAKLLLEKPDVLLLDEPTNYLDTEHIEWLIDYLNGFEGCFMVISHDYDFWRESPTRSSTLHLARSQNTLAASGKQ